MSHYLLYSTPISTSLQLLPSTNTTLSTVILPQSSSTEAPELCSFPLSTNNYFNDSEFIISDIPDRIPEDPRTEALRRYSYGIILPTICFFGIVGNILNLVVLTRRNMRGTAYIYMRGLFTLFTIILFALVFA